LYEGFLMNLVTSKDGTSIAYEREVRGPAVVLVALPGAGAPARTGELADVGRARDATAAQVALAWLLQRSPVMLPIPGTSRVAHLEGNVRAANLRLSDEEFRRLGRI
jgi:diketogulonate reductase-like aldo/keto reductase